MVSCTRNLTLWVLPLAFYFLLIELFVLPLPSYARIARYRKRYAQHCSALLAAARSQNGSGVINTIHYRSAASLPVESLRGGANSRTKPRRLDAREVFSILWCLVYGVNLVYQLYSTGTRVYPYVKSIINPIKKNREH